MRRTTATVALTLGFTLPFAVPAVAAELENGASQTCAGAGTWHFVNNQTGGADPGTLTAEFTTGVVMASAYKVNQNTQHFSVTTNGDATLLDASTGLPGRLVLSDFTCEDDGKTPPDDGKTPPDDGGKS